MARHREDDGRLLEESRIERVGDLGGDFARAADSPTERATSAPYPPRGLA